MPAQLIEHAPGQRGCLDAVQVQRHHGHVANLARSLGGRDALRQRRRSDPGDASTGAGASRSATLSRESSTLRASGTAACVRASSERKLRSAIDGAAVAVAQRACRGERAARSALSRVEASMSSPCLTMALPSAAASSRPVGNRSSRAADERAQHDRLELGGHVLGVRRRRLDDAGAHDVEQRLAPEPAVDEGVPRGSPRA